MQKSIQLCSVNFSWKVFLFRLSQIEEHGLFREATSWEFQVFAIVSHVFLQGEKWVGINIQNISYTHNHKLLIFVSTCSMHPANYNQAYSTVPHSVWLIIVPG